jgi:hypothetical protein
LAECLQDDPRELRKLVEEENPMMGQADLSWPDWGSPTTDSRCGCSMVGSSEGTPENESLPRGEMSRNGVDSRDRNRLVRSEGGEDSWKTSGQHCLPGSGWSSHEEIVPSGGGNLESPLGSAMPSYLGEVGSLGRREGQKLSRVNPDLGDLLVTSQVGNDLLQGRCAEDPHPGSPERSSASSRGCLPSIPDREEEGPYPEVETGAGHREASPHRTEFPIQTELSKKATSCESFRREVTRPSEQPESEGEIETAPFLF